MRQITVRQLVRQGSEANIRAWIPCEITADGEVIAILNDVRQTSTSSTMSDKVDKATEEDFVIVGGMRLRRKA